MFKASVLFEPEVTVCEMTLSLTGAFHTPVPFELNVFFSVSVLIVYLLFSRKLIFTELGMYLKRVLQKSAKVDALSLSY